MQRRHSVLAWITLCMFVLGCAGVAKAQVNTATVPLFLISLKSNDALALSVTTTYNLVKGKSAKENEHSNSMSRKMHAANDLRRLILSSYFSI